jgi:hypothetical protein
MTGNHEERMRKLSETAQNHFDRCIPEDDYLIEGTLDLIELRRRIIQANGKYDRQLYTVCTVGLLAWRRAATLLGEELRKVLAVDEPDVGTNPSAEEARAYIRFWLCDQHTLGIPLPHEDEFVALLLPPVLLELLVSVIDMLDHGETHPVLTPSWTGYRSTYSIVQERLRAWELVNFRKGRGERINSVAEEAAVAFGVSLATFEGWREDQLPDEYGGEALTEMLQSARKAGAMHNKRPTAANFMSDFIDQLRWDLLAARRAELVADSLKKAGARHKQALLRTGDKRKRTDRRS